MIQNWTAADRSPCRSWRTGRNDFPLSVVVEQGWSDSWAAFAVSPVSDQLGTRTLIYRNRTGEKDVFESVGTGHSIKLLRQPITPHFRSQLWRGDTEYRSIVQWQRVRYLRPRSKHGDRRRDSEQRRSPANEMNGDEARDGAIPSLTRQMGYKGSYAFLKYWLSCEVRFLTLTLHFLNFVWSIVNDIFSAIFLPSLIKEGIQYFCKKNSWKLSKNSTFNIITEPRIKSRFDKLTINGKNERRERRHRLRQQRNEISFFK